jgi:tetratricopeptide (TPR) repeat protein
VRAAGTSKIEEGLITMNARRISFAFAIALQSVAAFAAQRLNFTRTIAAAHDLAPAQEVAVVYAIGDNEKITLFLEDFLDRTNRFGNLHAESVVDPKRDAAELRRRNPADAYLGINQFTCETIERNAVGSERDASGDRVRRSQQWIDATCRARIDVMSGEGKRLYSFHVKGEGTSPRVSELTNEERNIAFEQAAHFAAVSAAEAITPRVVRESIELDAGAPAFDEAYSMIASSRFADARAIWESTLRRHNDSAALHFDLGAVCEALGDVTSARRYFEKAQQLSPSDTHYKSELMMFRRRNSTK